MVRNSPAADDLLLEWLGADQSRISSCGRTASQYSGDSCPPTLGAHARARDSGQARQAGYEIVDSRPVLERVVVPRWLWVERVGARALMGPR